MGLFSKIFGSYSEREIKNIQPTVDKVISLEGEFSALSDAELIAMTGKLRDEYSISKDLDALLPRAFATVREAAWRVLGMKHYPVQIMGGIILHQGRIAEMKTGEGKTLVAILPAYLNALTGKGVHVITVNDYLAQRDSEWMGKVFRFLGLSVGLIVSGLDSQSRQAAYNADITYGTGHEFGFDYLRDNIAIYKERLVQRGHNFAIVDEVDSILIDEARTPMIISGAGTKPDGNYKRADALVRKMRVYRAVEMDTKTDYEKLISKDYDQDKMAGILTQEQYNKLKVADCIIDEKRKSATLTAKGVKMSEEFFGIENLADPENAEIYHHILIALRAHGIMRRDRDYIVKAGEVLIVDDNTGRIMYGRRYNEGLHQAIEAKENVNIEKESVTLATISYQNFFRMYSKLSGMTGTAVTEKDEFEQIYALDVVEIPTNKPCIRKDAVDIVYKSEALKDAAVVKHVCECNAKGQPVLVGTASVERSEYLSTLLKKAKIKHQVLNAKYHDKEAAIIAQAGKEGAVTIATNMAGRGTDIILGGNAEFMAKEKMREEGFDAGLIALATGFAETDDEQIISARNTYTELYNKYKDELKDEAERVRNAGGLCIIGTERHESRRIDNQLRGRAGRQGDPGATYFYVSLEDRLVRVYSGDKVDSFLAVMGKLPQDVQDMPIENKMITAAIRNAQQTLESRHFQGRKNVMEYDNVMNKQREIIYDQRSKVLMGEPIDEIICNMIEETAENTAAEFISGEDMNLWDYDGLAAKLAPFGTLDKSAIDGPEKAAELTYEIMMARYNEQKEKHGEEFEEIQRCAMLGAVDKHWIEHLTEMDNVKEGIGLQSYGQRDPVVEFKFQSYDLFEIMIANIKNSTVFDLLSYVKPQENKISRREWAVITENIKRTRQAPVVVNNKVGRNDLCPCGSGKKYKKCCGIGK